MTAPEDRRDEDRFEQTLAEEERAAGAAGDAGDPFDQEDAGVPDFEPDEDLAAGPPDGR